jgi:hypothetical protein
VKRSAPVAAAVIAGIVLLSCGCASSHRGATGHTTVQRYDIYPADTISVPSTNPTSRACRHDSVGLAQASALFVAHSNRASVYPADLYYVLMREELADFDTRHCDLKLLGTSLVHVLSARQRRFLVTHAPRRMAVELRHALAAAGA